jgi:hypothetical protein
VPRFAVSRLRATRTRLQALLCVDDERRSPDVSGTIDPCPRSPRMAHLHHDTTGRRCSASWAAPRTGLLLPDSVSQRRGDGIPERRCAVASDRMAAPGPRGWWPRTYSPGARWDVASSRRGTLVDERRQCGAVRAVRITDACSQRAPLAGRLLAHRRNQVQGLGQVSGPDRRGSWWTGTLRTCMRAAAPL